ncbi:MAG: hypothetical protein O3A63_13380 [Proteobacteria bacterium]|nr:hypothetical protein [Pseudomonadota bacterium]
MAKSQFRSVFFGSLLTSVMLPGCSTTPQEYSWTHPDGGEYLFAFDARQCDAFAVQATSLTDASEAEPFFSCMQDRGYFLIDPATGRTLRPTSIRLPSSIGQVAR